MKYFVCWFFFSTISLSFCLICSFEFYVYLHVLVIVEWSLICLLPAYRCLSLCFCVQINSPLVHLMVTSPQFTATILLNSVWEVCLKIQILTVSIRVQVHQHQLLTTPPPPKPCHDCDVFRYIKHEGTCWTIGECAVVSVHLKFLQWRKKNRKALCCFWLDI